MKFFAVCEYLGTSYQIGTSISPYALLVSLLLDFLAFFPIISLKEFISLCELSLKYSLPSCFYYSALVNLLPWFPFLISPLLSIFLLSFPAPLHRSLSTIHPSSSPPAPRAFLPYDDCINTFLLSSLFFLDIKLLSWVFLSQVFLTLWFSWT